jgi:uncharacterized alkaline shock family protein YloU
MTTDLHQHLAATVARVARSVPGVACLSPRAASRLRRALNGLRSAGADPEPDESAVSISLDAWQECTTIEVALAVLAGYQASAVARQVRTAVLDAVTRPNTVAERTTVSVSVVVTGIV